MTEREKLTGYEIEKFKDSGVMENVMRDRAMKAAGIKLDLKKQYCVWTDEEITFVIENRNRMTAPEMSKKINKTVKQIYQKIYYLKINDKDKNKKTSLKPIYGGSIKPYTPVKVEKVLSEYIVKMNEERQYTGNLDACKGYRDCLKDIDNEADIEIFQLTEKRIVC